MGHGQRVNPGRRGGHGSVVLVDAAAARAGDDAAVAAGGTRHDLMAWAAHALARGVVEVAGRGYGLKVVVVVGKGNNGGDGWAAAPLLAARGASVTVVSLVDVDAPMSDEAAGFRRAWTTRGGRTVVGLSALAEELDGADVVVDCMLGTGASGAPVGDVASAVTAINDAKPRGPLVVACDLPTGIESDTGRMPGQAIAADLTVTFGALKRGLLLAPGSSRAGHVVVGELGPKYHATGVWRALTAAGAAPGWADPASDKVARGRVLVVAGSVGSGGAAVLSTRAALRAGAGLVTLATPAPVQRVLVPAVPAAMTRRLRHAGTQVAAAAVDDLADVEDFDAVVAGPGLGHGDGTRAVVDHLLRHARRLVLDADALNVHREDPRRLADHAGALVLTPHERELARIGGGSDGPDAWAHRVQRVPRLAAQLDAVVIAKGPGTMVAAPDGRVWVTPLGGPELGTGGSGDVLAGMVGAAVAPSGLEQAAMAEAAARAVWRHAFAGRRIAHRRGIDRLTADELAASIPDADGALARLARSDPTWPLGGPVRAGAPAFRREGRR